jgi:hypothetical protein
MTSKLAAGSPILSVRAEAVPLRIDAFKLGPNDYRIKLARGIGWAPTKYKTLDAVLKQLLAMRSYTVAEATICKAMCKASP